MSQDDIRPVEHFCDYCCTLLKLSMCISTMNITGYFKCFCGSNENISVEIPPAPQSHGVITPDCIRNSTISYGRFSITKLTCCMEASDTTSDPTSDPTSGSRVFTSGFISFGTMGDNSIDGYEYKVRIVYKCYCDDKKYFVIPTYAVPKLPTSLKDLYHELNAISTIIKFRWATTKPQKILITRGLLYRIKCRLQQLTKLQILCPNDPVNKCSSIDRTNENIRCISSIIGLLTIYTNTDSREYITAKTLTHKICLSADHSRKIVDSLHVIVEDLYVYRGNMELNDFLTTKEISQRYSVDWRNDHTHNLPPSKENNDCIAQFKSIRDVIAATQDDIAATRDDIAIMRADLDKIKTYIGALNEKLTAMTYATQIVSESSDTPM